MKRFLPLIFICLFGFTVAHAGLGIKKASEYIVMGLKEPLDSSGLPIIPDSAHILTYADNGSSTIFTTRSTTYPFSDISIDTTKNYGDTAYWFIDQIQDIDGAGGHFELAIIVTLFVDGLPTSTYNSVQIVSDSLNISIDTSNFASSSSILTPFTLLEGTMSLTKYHADRDTIFVITTTRSDTTSAIIYYHIGGSAGQRPDSVEMINWP